MVKKNSKDSEIKICWVTWKGLKSGVFRFWNFLENNNNNNNNNKGLPTYQPIMLPTWTKKPPFSGTSNTKQVKTNTKIAFK